MERSKLYAVVAAQAFDAAMWNPDCVIRVVADEAKALMLAGEGGHYACELIPVARDGFAVDADKAARDNPHAGFVDLGDGAGARVKSPEAIAADIARDFNSDGDPASGVYRTSLADIRTGVRAAIRRERAGVNTAGLDLPTADDIADGIIAEVVAIDDRAPKSLIRERVVAAVKAERARDYDALHEARRKAVIADQQRVAAASKKPAYQPRGR